MAKLSEDNMAALREFAIYSSMRGYARFPDGPDREPLRKAGLIERWNPIMKVIGRDKPWRITEAGRTALASSGGGR